MRAQIRRIWRVLTRLEKAVTIGTPFLVVGALMNGSYGEAIAWFVAGLWWSLYVELRVENADLVLENKLRALFAREVADALHRAKKRQHEREHLEQTSRLHRRIR